MLTVLGGLAEFERDLIRRAHRRRPSAGRGARAKNGPTAQLTPHQKREAIKRRDTGNETLAAATT